MTMTAFVVYIFLGLCYTSLRVVKIAPGSKWHESKDSRSVVGCLWLIFLIVDFFSLCSERKG